ncbi:hypothetical protein OG21DRAFT_1516098 [Imleria badia]|nr:hypothetical protein OG21DRAFT_1516098 [Imleria badia]
MQSSTATTTTTHRRRTDATGYNRHRNDEPAPPRVNARPNESQVGPKPAEPVSNTDFHLDTLFNPVWMSGSHVFSFAKDGTVVRPETYREEPYPGYRASAASSSGRGVNGAGAASYSPFVIRSARTRVSKASRRMDKPWKNVAITEQDDAEFAAMQAEAQVRAQAEAKSKMVGLVYTWPPKPQPAPCAECELLLGPQRREAVGTAANSSVGAGKGPRVRAGTSTKDSVVPALSYGSSGESESESEVFKVVPGRRAVGRRQEVPLEKGVGFRRAERKAPAPLVLAGAEEGEGENGWTRFGASHGEVEKVPEASFWNPFMPEVWAEDELTVRLKAILRMPDV